MLAASLFVTLLSSPSLECAFLSARNHYLAISLVLTSAACAAQERTHDASCPIEVAVAGTNVPLQDRDHIVLWFANQSPKTVAQVQFSVSLTSATNQYPASENYLFVRDIVPGNGGVVMHPTADEAARLGSAWKQIRGLEAQPVRVRFSDGTEWQPSGSTCKRSFLNQNYIESLRRWNKEVRFRWNLAHPNEPIPSSAMAGLLEQTPAR